MIVFHFFLNSFSSKVWTTPIAGWAMLECKVEVSWFSGSIELRTLDFLQLVGSWVKFHFYSFNLYGYDFADNVRWF